LEASDFSGQSSDRFRTLGDVNEIRVAAVNAPLNIG
jgi:hypothetical protein